MIETYRLLIGSIGDDSHSVGTSLLEIAFREAGFFVKNIGIMNILDDFFNLALDFDAILISCMNGHVDLYLKDFPFILRRFQAKHNTQKVWYLGGNLSVQDFDESFIRKYRQMGFDFVSPMPISCDAVMERLKKDFYNKGIKKSRIQRLFPDETIRISALTAVNDAPMPDQVFFTEREQVLESWPTGQGVRDAELGDLKKNHAAPFKNMHNVIVQSQTNGKTPLVQPRTGVAHTCDEIDILLYLKQYGLDISSIQLDAASRKKMYDKAHEGVLRTQKGKKSFLNGYPIPIHGVNGVKEILDTIATPFQVRAGSPDHRLVYEIALAGGASSLEGGFICYLFPYDKKTSPVESLFYWKYVDKLTEYYYKKYNVIVNREYFGPLTCCLVEPAIPICINIVQSILSAKAGVKCISVGLAEQGNRSQDIAALRVLDMMTRQYLAKYGFSGCTVSTVFHQYMAAFPNDRDKARDLIVNSSITSVLAGASRIMTKTPVESIHIPAKEDNAEGLQLTRSGLLKAKNEKVNQVVVKEEMVLLEKEVTAIMGAIEELGKGSIARGALRAFEEGLLDIPFSPSLYNKKRLITARDCDGAIRFVNPESMHFGDDIIDFHKEKIHQRMTLQRTGKIYEVLDSDLTRIWKNDYTRWPLDGHYVY
ncbi:MAG TPA: methylaspartate mutase subunit E [Candidatus Deferrimicrobium sp.]|nr:methylaspartate mutase subunit E [Candidatus Deferrimicrobium sp.]